MKRKKSSPPPVCHFTNVTFQVSHVTFQVSPVTYHTSDNIITTKLLELASCNFKTEFIPPCVLMSHVMCHMSPVTYQMSHVTCHMTHVICSFFFLGGGRGGWGIGQKLLHLLDGGSVIHWAHPVYF